MWKQKFPIFNFKTDNVIKIRENYINPLYKKNPVFYTIKGKKRVRFSNPFNYPKIQPKVENELLPEKIQDILIGCLLGDCGGEKVKAAKNPCFAFK